MALEVETPEKIYCCGGDNNNALMTAMMANGGGVNGMWNNPWAYMMMMYVMKNMNGNGQNGTEVGVDYNSRALATLQDTVNQNQLNNTVLAAINNNQDAVRELASIFHTDISTIQQGIGFINSSIQQVGGQIGLGIESVKNAVALGDNAVIRQLCDCCCSMKTMVMEGFNDTQRSILEGFNGTQREILNGTYQEQLATERQTNILGSKIDMNHAAEQLQTCQSVNALQSQLSQMYSGLQASMTNLGFQTEKNTAAIVQNNTAQTQRILDSICELTTQSLRDKLADKDREIQTQTILAQLKGSTTAAVAG